MNILITGAKGFVGRNLTETLKTIRDGKNRTRNVAVEEIYEYDIDTDPALLGEWCRDVDFVFHLAGVNRPQNPEEFMQGNFGFASTLLETLKKYRVRHCCYGHLHGPTIRRRLEGNRGGIEFSLISADYLEFIPKKICE